METTAPNGYNGAIDLVVAIDTQNMVLGARVVEHKETPGLGDKVDLRISDWILGFTNIIFEEQRQDRWQVKKDGGQFDQFTGATITPRAVVNAIKNAAIYGQTNMQSLFDLPSNCLSASNQIEQTPDNSQQDIKSE
jgi:electron transport complex protein RnfG